MRVSPDFKTREIVATGIRYPVGMRINKAGDLFATDQEGATWVPNGNPLDELLHIQKGRHYGFPARHPKYLPDVIDEPSTFDYGPQHQSTCGLNFNEPVKPGGPVFGPKEWAGDAIVTGESRGKLYRTQLVKTAAPATSPGRTSSSRACPCSRLIAASRRTAGCSWPATAVGRTGAVDRAARASCSRSPTPTAITRSRCSRGPAARARSGSRSTAPSNPQLLRDVLATDEARRPGGSCRAGDRFESLWPGYAIVQAQKAAPRFDVPVRSAQLTPDRRTLVLATDPLPAAVHYALTLPGMGRPRGSRRQGRTAAGTRRSTWTST